MTAVVADLNPPTQKLPGWSKWFGKRTEGQDKLRAGYGPMTDASRLSLETLLFSLEECCRRDLVDETVAATCVEPRSNADCSDLFDSSL